MNKRILPIVLLCISFTLISSCVFAGQTEKNNKLKVYAKASVSNNMAYTLAEKFNNIVSTNKNVSLGSEQDHQVRVLYLAVPSSPTAYAYSIVYLVRDKKNKHKFHYYNSLVGNTDYAHVTRFVREHLNYIERKKPSMQSGDFYLY